MRTLLFFILFHSIPSLSQSLSGIKLRDINHQKTQLNNILKGNKAVVFVFLSPECPLSKNYTKQLNEIYSEFKSHEIEVVAIFSGKNIEKNELQNFVEKYQLKTGILVDKNYELAKLLHASITPEVFLIDTKTEIVAYSGAIDNWAISLGQQRKTTSETYLIDALHQFLTNKTIIVSNTKAVGCFLEYK